MDIENKLLPIGTIVTIKNDPKAQGLDAGLKKKITGYKEYNNNTVGGYECDNNVNAIYLIGDFEGY